VIHPNPHPDFVTGEMVRHSHDRIEQVTEVQASIELNQEVTVAVNEGARHMP
jgi:hypothetical protein